MIGPNGAGKSTVLSTIMGWIKYSRARIRIGADGELDSIAYVPEHPVYYDYLTLWEHCEWVAAAYRLPYTEFKERAERLLLDFSLYKAKDEYPSSFSKGMCQKMMHTLALLRKPDFYLLDEPFSGLDPLASYTLMQWLEREKKRGAGLFMSTHMLDTAEKLCDSFVLISQGEMIAKGDLEHIRQQWNSPCASLFELYVKLQKEQE